MSDHVEIVELYFENGRSATEVQRKWSSKYGRHCRIPHGEIINEIVNRFRESGSVNDRPRSGRPSSEEAAQAVRGLIQENPSLSLRQISKQLGHSPSFVHNVCLRMLKLYPYRVQLHHALQPNDHSQRISFCEWIREKVLTDSDFLSNVFF